MLNKSSKRFTGKTRKVDVRKFCFEIFFIFNIKKMEKLRNLFTKPFSKEENIFIVVNEDKINNGTTNNNNNINLNKENDIVTSSVTEIIEKKSPNPLVSPNSINEEDIIDPNNIALTLSNTPTDAIIPTIVSPKNTININTLSSLIINRTSTNKVRSFTVSITSLYHTIISYIPIPIYPSRKTIQLYSTYSLIFVGIGILSYVINQQFSIKHHMIIYFSKFLPNKEKYNLLTNTPSSGIKVNNVVGGKISVPVTSSGNTAIVPITKGVSNETKGLSSWGKLIFGSGEGK